MTMSPVTKKRRVPLGNHIKNSQKLKLIFECRMPKVSVTSFTSCKNFFHIQCVNADRTDSGVVGNAFSAKNLKYWT